MNEFGRHAFYIELLEDYPRQKREEPLKKEREKSKERQSGLDKVINGRNQRNTTKTTRNKLKHIKGYTAKVLDIK